MGHHHFDLSARLLVPANRLDHVPRAAGVAVHDGALHGMVASTTSPRYRRSYLMPPGFRKYLVWWSYPVASHLGPRSGWMKRKHPLATWASPAHPPRQPPDWWDAWIQPCTTGAHWCGQLRQATLDRLHGGRLWYGDQQGLPSMIACSTGVQASFRFVRTITLRLWYSSDAATSMSVRPGMCGCKSLPASMNFSAFARARPSMTSASLTCVPWANTQIPLSKLLGSTPLADGVTVMWIRRRCRHPARQKTSRGVCPVLRHGRVRFRGWGAFDDGVHHPVREVSVRRPIRACVYDCPVTFTS